MKKLLIAGLLLMGATSCSVDNAVPEINDSDGIKTLDLTGSYGPVTHYFGANPLTAPGYVVVTNDDNYIYVTFQAIDDHKIVNSRLDIEGTPSGFPSNNGGNLPPGKMDEFKKIGTPDTQDIYEIPMSLFASYDCIYIAPWAIFTAGKGAPHYAGDILGGSAHHESWWYFAYGECNPVLTQVCNSAYALLGTYDEETGFLETATSPTLNSFYKDKPTNTNWGWYECYIFGASKEFALYTGAGQNDLNKGFQIGTVLVTYANGTVTATPTLWYPEISLDDHFFVSENLPPKRLAPGKFTNSGDNDGVFKMIFHTKACWNVVN